MDAVAAMNQTIPENHKLSSLDVSAVSVYSASIGSGTTLDDNQLRPSSAFISENGISRDLEEVVFCGRNGWYMR